MITKEKMSKMKSLKKVTPVFSVKERSHFFKESDIEVQEEKVFKNCIP